MTKRTHKQAVEAVRAFCRSLGGACWVLGQSAKLFGSAGIPDCFCLARGRVFWVEVKVGRDKLSEHQQAFKSKVEPHVPVLVGDVEVVMQFLGFGRREADA